MAPAESIWCALAMLGEKTELSAYPCQTPASRATRSISAASAPVRAKGLVHTTPFPAAAAIRTASRCASFGSAMTTRSTRGSPHNAAMSSYREASGAHCAANASARAGVRE